MKIRELLDETAADSFRKTLQSSPKKTKASSLKSFVHGIKKGYKQASDFQQNLPNTKIGKAAKDLGTFVQKIQRGPNR